LRFDESVHEKRHSESNNPLSFSTASRVLHHKYGRTHSLFPRIFTPLLSYAVKQCPAVTIHRFDITHAPQMCTKRSSSRNVRRIEAIQGQCSAPPAHWPPGEENVAKYIVERWISEKKNLLACLVSSLTYYSRSDIIHCS